ncbi:MAG: tryptophan--tRNA ligase [Bacilli bacterium]|nr:tryptophan--tRNA ligase [Bacilli bacterium]
MERLLTGLKPSGELTIGSYLGSIKQMVEYQNEYETFMFVPDLHAITVSQDPQELKSRIRKNIALYIACGINPEKVTLYIQSENLYHANLSWILECNSYFGEMSRMTQFKDKHSKGENITTGLFTYPALMASDILLYDADLVPVGKDQKQHVELARNIAERFNSKYGETFKVPSGLIPKTGAKIKDLVDPSKKMSKSEENYKGTILLLDSEKDIRKKIMSAVTDSDNKIYFDEENKPGISNLLTIYSSFKGINIKESEKIFENSNYGTFKKEVADVVATKLLEIQEKYQNIINSDLIDKILDEGRDKTIKLAKEKYEIVRKKIGLGR